MMPREVGGRLEHAVVKARPGLEIWPVGWEPEKSRRDVLPALFEFHNVNVQGVSAAVALEAIGKRLKVPVLLDHNALARHGIEPDKARETFQVPADVQPLTAMTIGYAADPSTVGDALKQRDEAPRQRKPLSEFVFGGKWGETSSVIS